MDSPNSYTILINLYKKNRMYNVGVEPTSPALRQVFLPKLKLFYTSVLSERFELSLLAELGFESSVSTISPQEHKLKIGEQGSNLFPAARKLG